MPRLVDRNRMIPGGYHFKISALNWESQKWQSFSVIVQNAITVLKANPHVAEKLGWDLSQQSMENRVDEYNAIICQKMNWTEFYTGESGGSPVSAPFYNPLQHQNAPRRVAGAGGGNMPPPIRTPVNRPEEMPRMSGSVAQAVASVKKLAAGAATLFEWETEGMPHVEQAVADSRAGICAQCPKNVQGKHLSEYFTESLSGLIQKRFEKMKELDMKTPFDDRLNVCDACLCPMRTKVWFPYELVVKRLRPETKSELNQANPKCWILSEIDERAA